MPLSRLGALRVVDPKKWEKEIRAAMKAADGDVAAAAKTLEVSPRQLFRWIAEGGPLADVARQPAGRRWPEKEG